MTTFAATDHRPFDPAACYDPAPDSVHILDLRLDDPIVVAEARRWSTGERGPSVDTAAMTGADLEPFVRHAVTIGVHALTAAGSGQDKLEFAQLVDDLGTRTSQAAEQATAQTAALVQQAALGMQKAAAEARQAVLEAQQLARRDFAEHVQTTRTSIETELTRVFGGDDPALLARLRPLLDRFAAELQRTGVEETSKLIEQTRRLFNVDDPASPLAKQAALLQRQQTESEATHARRSRELEGKIAELSTVVERAFAAKQATAVVIQTTTAKGVPYEDAVHAVMYPIAAGLGDTYQETGTLNGAVNRSKKGDARLVSADGSAVVLEMTSGGRSDWTSYLDEAERNRTAQASLGLVRDPSLLHGQTISCLGPRRIVMAFDPERDDPALLRTVNQLLRLAARNAVRQQHGGSIDAVDDKLTEALAQLATIAAIQKAANLTRQHANTVYVQVEALRDNLERILTQAKTALAAAEDDTMPAAA